MATKKKMPKKKTAKPSRPAKKAVQKPAAKKAAAKKTSKKPLKKQASRKPAGKKTAPHPARKPATKRPSLRKAPAKKSVAKPAARKASAAKSAPAPKPLRTFRAEELAHFRSQLQQQLELIQNNLNSLASDNLKRSPVESTGDISSHSTHMADHGTDNFDRELALNLASSRQESIYDIEDAIRRIDDGSYGACEMCGKAIERARLKALPFAKKCLVCQSAAERGRTKYRPFGGSLPLQQLATEDAAESAEPPDSMT
ncbi:MAG: TraR/DksA family transcriptional regulator [Kiritimatiellia bacterium]